VKYICQYDNCANYSESGESVVVSGGGFKRRFCCWGHAIMFCMRMDYQLPKALPTLNLNGTAGQDLQARHLEVVQKIREALHLMSELTTPHGRDYPKKGEHNEAMNQFTQYYKMLEHVVDIYGVFVDGIQIQIDQRERQKEGK